MRLRASTAILALALCACRRSAPTTHAAPPPPVPAAQRPAIGAADRCRTGQVIAVAPLILEWQEGESVRRLALGADGTVRRENAVFGSFAGACLLDARGNVLSSVDARGQIASSDGATAGSFKTRKSVQVDGQSVAVTEVFESTDGQGSAIDDQGTVYVVSRSGESSSMPAHVEGDVIRARRAALLLLEARPGFGSP